MSAFDLVEYDDHAEVHFFNDPKTGLRCIVAIHRIGPMGIAGGGCRFYPFETSEEGLRDALRLSAAMTRKMALAGTPVGGAKSVVIGDPASQKTPELLRALGKVVESLNGRYMMGTDVGTNTDDMAIVAEETSYVVGKGGVSGDTGPATAHGVYFGVKAAVRHALERDSLEGLTVAVQGLGGVGHNLCAFLAEAGATLTVADVNLDAVQSVVDEFGATAVSTDEILFQDVDLLAPCALGNVLNDETIPRLRCRVVVGAANNQLALPDQHAQLLRQRGILYAPDFVINAGGVIGSQQTLGQQGPTEPYDPATGAEKMQRIAEILADIFNLSDQDDISTHEAAIRISDREWASLEEQYAKWG